MTFEGFPFIVGWELTLACNLRCKHCGSSAGPPRTNELTTKEALDLCEQFPSLLVREVDFTGDEPLLRSDWPVIAARLIQLGMTVNVLTNGLHLDTDTVSKMKEIGISAVGISLDGLAETHDSLRNREGSFDAVLRSIALIRRASIPLNVITTVNSTNIHELPGLVSLLHSLGVKYWRLQPIISSGRGRFYSDLPLDEDGILQLGRFIKSRKLNAALEGIELIRSDGLEYVDEDACRERPWRGCSAGISACGITSQGKVKGCLSMPDELVEGDVRENTLWDIWFHPNSFAYTRKFAEEQLGPNCKSCDKALECKGGCSSSSYCSTGLFHNDFPCFYKSNAREVSLCTSVPLERSA